MGDIDPPKVVPNTETPKEYIFDKDDYIVVLAECSGTEGGRLQKEISV